MFNAVVFNPEITLGSLIAAVSVIGSAIAIWNKLNQDVALMRQRVEMQEKYIMAHAERISKVEEIIGQLERNITILTTIEEMRHGKRLHSTIAEIQQ